MLAAAQSRADDPRLRELEAEVQVLREEVVAEELRGACAARAVAWIVTRDRPPAGARPGVADLVREGAAGALAELVQVGARVRHRAPASVPTHITLDLRAPVHAADDAPASSPSRIVVAAVVVVVAVVVGVVVVVVVFAVVVVVVEEDVVEEVVVVVEADVVVVPVVVAAVEVGSGALRRIRPVAGSSVTDVTGEPSASR